MRSTFKVIAGLMLVVFAGQAFADLAATHIIRNSVTVDYDDAGGAAQTAATADVDITVNLVEAAPTVAFDSLASDPLDPVGVGETISLVYTVTSNANGLDTYTVGTAQTPNPGGVVTFGTITPPSPVSLGATTASLGAAISSFEAADVAAGAGTQITVPADDNGDGADINGLVIGDTVRVAGGICIVNDITEPGAGNEANATATLEVDQCVGTGTLNDADQIGEQLIVTVEVTGDTAGTADVTVTFTSDTGTNPSANGGTQSVVIAAPNVQVFKFVRNQTTANNPASCTGTTGLADAAACVSIGGNTYYKSGVTTDPGDTLDYAIVIVNSGALATAVQVTDAIAAFTTFSGATITVFPLADSATPDVGADCVTDGATCTIVDAGSLAATSATGDDAAELNGGNVEASAGHDGAGAAIGDATSGGELSVDEYSVVLFSVDVDA